LHPYLATVFRKLDCQIGPLGLVNRVSVHGPRPLAWAIPSSALRA
jgi:hypothetical protein